VAGKAREGKLFFFEKKLLLYGARVSPPLTLNNQKFLFLLSKGSASLP
jgi:hypothetical protein